MFRRDLMYTYESRNGDIKRSHEKFFYSLGDAKINIFVVCTGNLELRLHLAAQF